MRTYKPKTNRVRATKEQLEKAANAILNEGYSVRYVARETGIPITTLARFMRRVKTEGQVSQIEILFPRQIFNKEQEAKLKDYLLQTSAIYFGLTSKDVRFLAYDCALQFHIHCPDNWTRDKMAGKDWLTAFLKRNPEFSIRPEQTSLGRATSFNRTNVDQFYGKLRSVLLQYKFTASRIWNIDETDVSTVSRPNKIVAAKGKRNIGSITSARCGTNVTLITAVSASGNTVPPMFIFPRKRYKDHFLSNAPPDSIGMGNASGGVTNNEFYVFMEHFIKHVKPSVEDPILLLLDNHSAHLGIQIVSLAKKCGVIMFSFPPHCSHRLQPLDVSVFESFKKYLATAQDGWLCSNAGKKMTIFDISEIVAEALPLAATGRNIMNGFKKTGIFPYNRDIFTDSDFASSYVTDHPEDQRTSLTPVLSNVRQVNVQAVEKENASPNKDDNLGLCTARDDPVPSTSKDIESSPEIIKPLPKAKSRKHTQVKRRKRKATILTDTTEKDSPAEEQNQRKKTEVSGREKELETKQTLQESMSEDDQYYYFTSDEAYSQSLSKKGLVQCNGCLGWALVKFTCTISVCSNCNSTIN